MTTITSTTTTTTFEILTIFDLHLLFLGFSGKSINLYSYAANNPVMLKDPRGRCLPFNVVGGPLGAVLNAGTNVAAYVAAQTLNNQKITIGGKIELHVTNIYSSWTLIYTRERWDAHHPGGALTMEVFIYTETTESLHAGYEWL